MANTYLTKAFSSSTSTTKATWSFWVKFSAVNTGVSGTGSMLFQARNSASSNNFRTYIRYEENGTLDFICYNATGTKIGEYYTSRVFRDPNAWYHICYSLDTTLNTASDRLKLYVNGVRETSFYSGSYTEIGQNETVKTTSSVFTDISRNGGTAGYYFNGILSHYILTDGYVYQASTFGSTDTTTGEWKINPSPTISNWGSNGFWILKDGASTADVSPNNNTFTIGGGTLTKTEDNPSNVFATMNPLDNYFASSTFSNGNNTIVTNQSNYTWNTGTLGMTSGKFYWEVKYSANSNSELYNLIGIADRPTDDVHDVLGRQTNCSNYGYYAQTGGIYAKSTSITSYGNAYGVGDIVGVAVDLDNSKLYFSKNGTWQNSGVPTSGSTGTGAFSIDAISSTTTGVYFPASGDYGSSQYVTNQHNFGNGFFGTTAITTNSGNGYSGAEGSSKFNYIVPTGYSALSTKGLNE
jgi:hypothetical protein